MPTRSKSRVFWSGGSQAVRLPKAMRLTTDEVLIERRGNGLLIIPADQKDDWADFWEALGPLRQPIQRWKTRRAETRGAL